MDMAGISGSAVTMNGPATAASRTRGGFRDTTVAGLPPGPDSLARLANELEAGRLDPGDVRDHPLYIVNGRPPADPERVTVRRGDRMRPRLINPSADTIFCVFVENH